MAESRKSAASVAVALMILVILLPILYVLSIGPAAWLVRHNYLNEDIAVIVYFPVIAAAEKFEWFSFVLKPWVELFE
jgi:hypothetical protein